jgi:hypothetical protein
LKVRFQDLEPTHELRRRKQRLVRLMFIQVEEYPCMLLMKWSLTTKVVALPPSPVMR